MNCQQLTAQLDEYLDRQLDESAMAACAAHLQDCPSCQQRLAAATLFRAALRGMPVPGPRRGFTPQVLAAAHQVHRARHRVSYFSGFATATVLAIAVMVGVRTWYQPPVPSVTQTAGPMESSLQTVSVSLHEPRSVRLVFTVPRDMEQVTLRVDLPQNVILAKGKASRQVEWQTALSKGDNVLTLPLQAIGYGEGELSAVLIYQGVEKVFRLRVLAQRNDASAPVSPTILSI